MFSEWHLFSSYHLLTNNKYITIGEYYYVLVVGIEFVTLMMVLSNSISKLTFTDTLYLYIGG